MAVAAGMYGASVLAGQSQQIQMPPLTLVVVVDVTASMDPSEQVTLVVSGLGGLLEPGDRVRLGRIARTVAFGPWFAAPDSVAEAARVLEAPEGDQLGPSPNLGRHR